MLLTFFIRTHAQEFGVFVECVPNGPFSMIENVRSLLLIFRNSYGTTTEPSEDLKSCGRPSVSSLSVLPMLHDGGNY